VARPKRRKENRDSRSSRAAPKSIAYEALAALNQHFEQVLQNFDRLRQRGLFDNRFRRESMQACQAAIEETQSRINFEITESLRDIEEHDWARFGEIRQQREEKLEDPQDVLIKAERLSRKTAVRKGPRTSELAFPSASADCPPISPLRPHRKVSSD